MPNMSLVKQEMPTQAPDVRNKNYEEVSLGYTKEQAMEEATRCLNCKLRNHLKELMVLENIATGHYQQIWEKTY